MAAPPDTKCWEGEMKEIFKREKTLYTQGGSEAHARVDIDGHRY